MIEDRGLPRVSVVIPTYNSSKTIGECLKSIKRQNYERIEIVVVDNFSEDDTVEIAQKYGSRIISREAGMAEARNIGIKNTDGEIVFSVDSDMKLRKDVIEKGVKKIRGGADAVIIPEVSVGEGFWTGVKWLKKLLHLGDRLFESPRMFRREILEQVNYYDPDLLDGEDYDLHIRLRKRDFKIDYISTVIEHMEGKLTLLEWLQEKYRYGRTTERFKAKHTALYEKKGSSRYPTFFLRNWKKLSKYPHFAFGLFLFKILSVLPWRFKVPPEQILPPFMK